MGCLLWAFGRKLTHYDWACHLACWMPPVVRRECGRGGEFLGSVCGVCHSQVDNTSRGMSAGEYSSTRPQTIVASCHLQGAILTHLPLVPWVRIGSGNGLSPVWRQAITWTNAALLSIGSLGTNFSEILIKTQNFSFTKMHLKMSSAKVTAILSRGRRVNTLIETVQKCLPFCRDRDLQMYFLDMLIAINYFLIFCIKWNLLEKSSRFSELNLNGLLIIKVID